MMSFAPDPSVPPGYASAPKKGWFGRNWLWFVPTVVLLPICLCGGLCFGGAFFAFQGLKSSEAYKMALEATQQNAEVQAAIGEPIEETLVPAGAVNTSATEGGHAALVFRVTGPKGAAVVETESTRAPGSEKWEMTRLVVRPENGEVIVIVGDEEAAPLDEVEIDFQEAEMPAEDQATEESETEEPGADNPAAEEPAADEADAKQPE